MIYLVHCTIVLSHYMGKTERVKHLQLVDIPHDDLGQVQERIQKKLDNKFRREDPYGLDRSVEIDDIVETL